MNKLYQLEVYKLSLFESLPLTVNSSITRVPGGWVYGDMQGCCFVPWDNEFQINKGGEE